MLLPVVLAGVRTVSAAHAPIYAGGQEYVADAFRWAHLPLIRDGGDRIAPLYAVRMSHYARALTRAAPAQRRLGQLGRCLACYGTLRKQGAQLFRKAILLGLLAIVAMASGGTSAIGKPVDGEPSKASSCVKVSGFTEVDGRYRSQDVCPAGTYQSYKIFRGGKWGSGWNKAWVTETNFEGKDLGWVPCKDAPGPPNPDCTVGVKHWLSIETLACHTAPNVVITRVLLVRRKWSTITFTPVKHTTHGCSVKLAFDNVFGTLPELRIDSEIRIDRACEGIYVIGARGSGETNKNVDGYGRTIYFAINSLRGEAA